MSNAKRVLVVGSGAREHALASVALGAGYQVIVAPGNAGTELVARNASVQTDDVPGVVELAESAKVDLVIVGPEVPLTLGLVDALAARGVRAFGPTRAAARLEGSKAFMKRFCERHRIATAPFAVFDDAAAAERHVRSAVRPPVVKADGLASGKGVVVADSVDEACAAVDRMMRREEFGAAGRTVVIEDRLGGDEASFHALCDGTRAVALPPAQDHKRVGDGDAGPNTGGMGAYAPAPVLGEDLQERVMREIVEPTLAGMASEGAPFRGVLFVGLMIERGEPRVLEYNVRFGDPEATVILPMIDGDWVQLFGAAADGDISRAAAPRASGAALSVVMAAQGYPGAPRRGDPILGLDAVLPPGAFVFHAGTARDAGGRLVTSGGRVLTVGARAPSLADAARIAYDLVGRIHWEGEHHRRDIGGRALGRHDEPTLPDQHG
jgi:phosphoribosylamine--glycine ligase